MADEHHEDHGNTLSAWFLTVSWIVVWAVAGVSTILGGSLILWTVVALVLSVACAGIAGALKLAGFGRKGARIPPLTAAEWAAQQGGAIRDGDAATVGDDGESGKEYAVASAS